MGKNFFSDTKVAIGDKLLSTDADGLTLKSNETFEVRTTIDALANGPGEIISRYGAAVPLILPNPTHVSPAGFEIQSVELSAPKAGTRTITIHLSGVSVATLPSDAVSSALNLPATPIITMNDRAIPLPYTIVSGAGNLGVILQANVPDSFTANSGGVIKVSWPFSTARKMDEDSSCSAHTFRRDPTER